MAEVVVEEVGAAVELLEGMMVIGIVLMAAKAVFEAVGVAVCVAEMMAVTEMVLAPAEVLIAEVMVETVRVVIPQSPIAQ